MCCITNTNLPQVSNFLAIRKTFFFLFTPKLINFYRYIEHFTNSDKTSTNFLQQGSTSSTIHQVLSPSCPHWSSPSSGWRPPTQSTDPRPVPPGIASGGKTGRKGRKRASTEEMGPSYLDLYERLKSKYCL